jgi:hypothetical protein
MGPEEGTPPFVKDRGGGGGEGPRLQRRCSFKIIAKETKPPPSHSGLLLCRRRRRFEIGARGVGRKVRTQLFSQDPTRRNLRTDGPGERRTCRPT